MGNADATSISIAVDASQLGRPFRHFYLATGYANADYTYAAPMLRMLDYLSTVSRQGMYVRMHNILTTDGLGDYHVVQGQNYGSVGPGPLTRTEDGTLHYDWTVTDRIYDALIQRNLRPIVETIFVPKAIQEGDREPGILPRSFDLWQDLIAAFVAHVYERYGRDEVRKWYFEIWNEPCLDKYWGDGPYDSFFMLYDHMVAGVDRIDPLLKVGGPATQQEERDFRMFEAFLAHCAHGQNSATQGKGTRLDFVSVHCKGGTPFQEVQHPLLGKIMGDLERYLQILIRFPEHRNVEFFNDESDPIWNGHVSKDRVPWVNFRNTHYFPGFLCKMATRFCELVEDKYGIQRTMMVCDNGHLPWEKYLFSGNRSQFTSLFRYPSTDILKKPVFNAIPLLHKLGNERLTVTASENAGREIGWIATRHERGISILLWCFDDDMQAQGSRRIELALSGLEFLGPVTNLIHYRVDQTHSSSYAAWEAAGCPEQPSPEEIQAMRRSGDLALYEPVQVRGIEDGRFTYTVDLPMHAVSLIQLLPVHEQAPSPPEAPQVSAERGVHGNPQVFLWWRPAQELDIIHYEVSRARLDDSRAASAQLLGRLTCSSYMDMAVEDGAQYRYSVRSINAAGQVSGDSPAAVVQVPGNLPEAPTKATERGYP